MNQDYSNLLIFFYRQHVDEDETLYEVQLDSCEPFISFFPVSTKCESYNALQFLHHGSIVIHSEDEGSKSACVFLRLEKDNGTLTWCKPPWGASKSNPSEFHINSDTSDFISPGFLAKYDSTDITHGTVDDGYLDLAYTKEVRISPGDISNISKKYNIPEEAKKSHIRILYGSHLSDNRIVYFVAPTAVIEVWYKGLQYVAAQLKKQRMLTDHRIFWLKEKYAHLYFEDLACAGPTPAEAIKVMFFVY